MKHAHAKRKPNQKLPRSNVLHNTLSTRLSWLGLGIFGLIFASVGVALLLRSSASPMVTGDVDNNGVVNIVDLSLLLSHWAQTGNTAEDLDGNGLVNVLDLSILLSHYGQTGTAGVSVTVDVTSPSTVSQFETGASHTQDDLTLNGSTTQIQAARQIISSALYFENVPIMGWGSPDPEPSSGTYDWSMLDARVQFMRSTGTTKMITLCCAPGWMRDPAYSDDWQYLDQSPTPAHYQDFANLAKQVAQRYTDVQYFQVWNELKGFYNNTLNRWDYEGYTTFYNMVYGAIKSVRPDAKIGGPYVVVDNWAATSAGGHPAVDPTLYNQPWGTIDQRSLDVITYWLAHRSGGDYLVVDGGTNTREGTWLTDEFTAGNYFPAVVNWIRKQSNGGATLPIGFAEWYPNTPQTYTDINHYNAVFASDLILSINSGLWYALPWGTQGDSQGLHAFPASFMTSSGVATAEYTTLMSLKNNFGSGLQLNKISVSDPGKVIALATSTKTLLVNKTADALTVSVNGSIQQLQPYEVRTIDTPH